MRLGLTTAQIEAMKREAREAYPKECCGLLVGRRVGDDWRVERIVPSPNVSAGDRRRQFEVDPAIRIRFERELRGGDFAVIGHFHSHPRGQAMPSEADLKAAFEPSLLWLIIAVDQCGTCQTAVFRLNPAGDGFQKLDLKVV